MNDGWRLPTRDELNEMYSKFRLKDIGNFVSDYYWSSSESDSSHAYGQEFGNGYLYNGSKSDSLRVHLVRSLPEGECVNGLKLTLNGEVFEVADNDVPKQMTWYEAMESYGVVSEDNILEPLTAVNNVWMNKANLYLHLLHLVKDEVKDTYILGLVKAALEDNSNE